MGQLVNFFKPRQARPADIRDVTDLQTPVGQQVIAIYEQSFPEVARDPVEDIAASLYAPIHGAEVNHLRALVFKAERSKTADYITPPVAEGQPSLPFRLMVLRAVPKSGMHALAASKRNKGIA